MTTSRSSTYSLNSEIENKRDLLAFVERDDLLKQIREFEFDWSTGQCNSESELFRLFKENDWINSEGRANRLGKLVYGRIALHFNEFDEPQRPDVGNYRVVNRLRSGKNSVIFTAEHKVLGQPVVLKFIRPGASDDIESSLKKLAKGHFNSVMVMPIDVIRVPVNDFVGKSAEVTCLVFPLLDGQTLNDLLAEKSYHLNSHVIISFIKQVGGALEELERLGAYHGDLHAYNILVEQSVGGALQFRLLDISYDAIGSQSLQQSRNGDLENFKQHIWRMLSTQKGAMPYVSTRKFLGTNYFEKVRLILSERTTSFREVMEVFQDQVRYRRYLEAQSRFLADKFVAPNSFRLQRYEEFTTPSVAARLFVPFPELAENINKFGNVYVSGSRGSGKSTYLASLGFFPSIDGPNNKFTETFGIYFPCRQGEFRALTPLREGEEDVPDQHLLHVLLIKIVRRTLEALAEGAASKKLSTPLSCDELREFLNRIVPAPGIISLESDVLSEIDNFVSTIVRTELEQTKALWAYSRHGEMLLTAKDLIRFFEIVRSTYAELKATRFHLLFDDAGEPYSHRKVHQAINELIINSNPIYCVKLSAEKNTYWFQTFDGKQLENGHDYYTQDITSALFLGSGTSGIKKDQLEEYFRQIVEQRLSFFEYRSNDIRDYLGDVPSGEDRLTVLLAFGQKNAYYSGWTTVWNIADRNPRNLLELVSEIFASGNIEKSTNPSRVPSRDQSRAIKSISEKRLKSLTQIAGAFVLDGQRTSLGRKLFQVTATIGSTFYTYLRQEVRNNKRGRSGVKGYPVKSIRQHLAIERNELSDIKPEADYVLQKLVTYGVLDDSKTEYSRDDQIKKPIYVLNRIYCPAFSIGYRRDEHLRLSKVRLEQLLLDPQTFLKEGTRRLRVGSNSQIELFGYTLSELEHD